MARLISYPTISTLALGDLFPVTDVSGVGKPLKNVTGTDLLGFIEANAGLWEKTATGINYPGGTVGIGATVPIASSMITVANTRTEPSTSVNSFYNLTYANTANSTASIYGTVNRYINSSSFSSKDLVSINNIARTTGTGAITNIYAAYNIGWETVWIHRDADNNHKPYYMNHAYKNIVEALENIDLN